MARLGKQCPTPCLASTCLVCCTTLNPVPSMVYCSLLAGLLPSHSVLHPQSQQGWTSSLRAVQLFSSGLDDPDRMTPFLGCHLQSLIQVPEAGPSGLSFRLASLSCVMPVSPSGMGSWAWPHLLNPMITYFLSNTFSHPTTSLSIHLSNHLPISLFIHHPISH